MFSLGCLLKEDRFPHIPPPSTHTHTEPTLKLLWQSFGLDSAECVPRVPGKVGSVAPQPDCGVHGGALGWWLH